MSKAFIHVDADIVQETSTSPNANARIRMGHTDQQVHTKAQVRQGLSFLLIRCLIHDKVACSHTAVAPTGTSHTPSAFALTHASSPTRVKVEEGQSSPIDHRYTPNSPHTLIHRTSLASISRKRPTAGSCSTTTTIPIPPAPSVPGSLEARTHRSSSSTGTLTIQQISFEFTSRGIQPPIVQKRPENVSSPPTGTPPHLSVPPSSHSSPNPPVPTHRTPSMSHRRLVLNVREGLLSVLQTRYPDLRKRKYHPYMVKLKSKSPSGPA